MKKMIGCALASLSVLTLASCGGKGADLLILNWGDYIASDVIEAFEAEKNVKVKVAVVESNEQMYQNILNQTAEYDLVVPSDYMLDQMKQDNLIKEMDYSKLENYQAGMFVDELETLMSSSDCAGYKDYYIPYFWGSLGIMYNKTKTGVEEAVQEHGFKVLFEQNLLPSGSKVGMYNVSRDALAAAELYKGYSLNTTDTVKIDECMDLLKSTTFASWGTDDLKSQVAKGNLDVALVYSGDFFDAYYADIEAGDEANTEKYSIYAPTEHNNVFFDAMAIPVTTTSEDLAYQFLDFLLEYENSYTNAEFVGYCPTVASVYDQIMEDEEGWGDITAIEAYNPVRILNSEGSRAEVYKYLGSSVYAHIESKFTEVLAG